MPAVSPTPSRQVVPIPSDVHSWIEPWYGAYAILGALASGFAVIAIPVVISRAGGGGGQIGAAIAAQNVGVVFAPLWGGLADRTRAYRAIFFAGFILIGLGFLGFTFLQGWFAWLASAFLIGLGTGASNTVAALFVVEFAPKSQWSSRISWMQTFNAAGSVFGMAFAGVLSARLTTLIAALLVIPALLIGGRGLPVPGGEFHMPRLRHALEDGELFHLLRHSGPNAVTLVANVRRPRRKEFARLAHLATTAFGLFLVAWFLFSLAVSSFSSLYPVLMEKSFGMDVARASMIMSIATGVSIPLYNFAGRLSSRHGPTVSLMIGVGCRVLAFGGLAGLAFLQPGWAMLPVVVLVVIFQGVWPLLSVASNDLAADLAQIGEGTAMGLFNAVAALASACGAVVGGQIADHFGYPTVCAFAALGALASLVCALALRASPSTSAAASRQTAQRQADAHRAGIRASEGPRSR